VSVCLDPAALHLDWYLTLIHADPAQAYDALAAASLGFIAALILSLAWPATLGSVLPCSNPLLQRTAHAAEVHPRLPHCILIMGGYALSP